MISGPEESEKKFDTIACLGFYRNWVVQGDGYFRMAWKDYDR